MEFTPLTGSKELQLCLAECHKINSQANIVKGKEICRVSHQRVCAREFSAQPSGVREVSVSCPEPKVVWKMLNHDRMNRSEASPGLHFTFSQETLSKVA